LVELAFAAVAVAIAVEQAVSMDSAVVYCK
jgi:hypothetical protein